MASFRQNVNKRKRSNESTDSAATEKWDEKKTKRREKYYLPTKSRTLIGACMSKTFSVHFVLFGFINLRISCVPLTKKRTNGDNKTNATKAPKNERKKQNKFLLSFYSALLTDSMIENVENVLSSKK